MAKLIQMQHTQQGIESTCGQFSQRNSTALSVQSSPIKGVVLSLPDSNPVIYPNTTSNTDDHVVSQVTNTANRTDGGVETERNSVPDLPVQLAIIEVLEYMILSCDNGVQDRNTLSEFHVKIRTLGELKTEHVCFQVKVLGTCNRLGQFDVNVFLRGHAVCLEKLIREMEAGHNGGHLWTEIPTATSAGLRNLSTEWELRCRTHSTPFKQEYKESSPHAKVVFRVMQRRGHMLSECEELEIYMHRLQLANPHINITFSLNVGGAKSATEFGGRREESNTDRRKPLLDIEHYMSVDDGYEGPGQLQLRMSSPCKLSAGLRMTVGAALIPPLAAGDLLLNTDCSSVQILVYGPGRLPVMVPGLQMSALRPASWLNLHNYGLRLGQQVEAPRAPGLVLADCRYELLPTGDNNDEERDDSFPKYTVQIFVFIDMENEDATDASAKLCMNDQLRQTLSIVFPKHRSKIQKGTCSALSKLLKNRLVDQQRQKLMETTIPGICSALSDVVRRSTSDTFRTAAFASLQVDDTRSLHQAVGTKLWDIAIDRFGVQRREKQDRPRISGPRQKENSSIQARGDKKKRQRHSEGDLQCKKAKAAQDAPPSSSAGSADCTPPGEWALTSAESQGQHQGQTQAGDPTLTLLPPSDAAATDMECQDLDSFDLLGLDLGADALQLDPAVVKDVLGDLVDATSGHDVTALVHGDLEETPDHFDLFSHCEAGAGVFDDDWLGDLLSTL